MIPSLLERAKNLAGEPIDYPNLDYIKVLIREAEYRQSREWSQENADALSILLSYRTEAVFVLK